MVHCRVQMYFYRTAHGPLPRSDVLSMYCTRPAAAFKCTYTVPRTVHCRVPMHELLPPHHRCPGRPLYDPSPGGQPLGCQHSIEWAGRSSGKSGDVQSGLISGRMAGVLVGIGPQQGQVGLQAGVVSSQTGDAKYPAKVPGTFSLCEPAR